MLVAANDIDRLLLQATTLRDRADAARRLAREVEDDRAMQSLNEHAEEYERQAAELDARIAILKQGAASHADDIAAVKLPPEPDAEGGAR